LRMHEWNFRGSTTPQRKKGTSPAATSAATVVASFSGDME
jgi:hypothetical protein